jgi:hypothetical protein
MPPTRLTAQQRREQVLAVAEQEFATAGLHGASTETIARRRASHRPTCFACSARRSSYSWPAFTRHSNG